MQHIKKNDKIFSYTILKKQEAQEQRLEEISKAIDNLNFIMNTRVLNGYNYREDSYIDVFGKDRMDHSEQVEFLGNIISEMTKLEGLDDIRDQISHCAFICDKTLNLLKIYHCSDENNYCKKTLHLFFQAVKRNYAKNLFLEEQITVLLDMLKEIKSFFIDEDAYWKFDERLYDTGLAVFPEEE